MSIIEIKETKVCKTCGESKELTEFYSQEMTNKYGVKYIRYDLNCKKCYIARGHQWQVKNKKKQNEYNKKSYYGNKDHRPGMANRKESGRRWRTNNSERCCELSKRHKNHDISDIEWEDNKKYFDYECAYCGLPLEEHYVERNGELKHIDFHKEHVIDNGKNNLSNCVPSCQRCNSSKHEKTLNEFYNSNNPDYTYERYYKIYLWIRYDHKKYILPKRRYKRQRMITRLKEIEDNKSA